MDEVSQRCLVRGSRLTTMLSLQASAVLRFKLQSKVILSWVKMLALAFAGGRRTVAVVLKSKNGLFAVDVRDQNVSRRLAQGEYGADEIARLEKLVTPTSDLLIVGGHIGSLAVPLCRSVLHVDVVEANPENFGLLEMNKRLNGCDNMVLHPTAASNDDTPLTFLASRTNSGGSKRLPQLARAAYTYDRPREVTVSACRLDVLFADRTFDVILMDIEGSEYYALLGMPGLLRRATYLVMEFVPHHLEHVAGVEVAALVAALAPAGFKQMYRPGTGDTYAWADVPGVLADMYVQGKEDDGLVFSS